MAAIRGVPHPFPYQGSKRQLAREILSCFPAGVERLIEPFAGSAAITMGAAYLGRAKHFTINDAHRPLILLWKAILHEPEALAERYRRLWVEQEGRERDYYNQVRAEFNRREQPHHFLYLLARCVKAAVRYNSRGEFNNSPDNRRRGMHPDEMERNILGAARLLRGKVRVTCVDFRDAISEARPEDIVYMDPPYQGVCNTHDHRYCHAVHYHDFAAALEGLNVRGISYIVSYDGRTGAKTHGRALPDDLGLTRIELFAGRSTQATLLGLDHETYESLYLSPALMKRWDRPPRLLRSAQKEDLFSVTP